MKLHHQRRLLHLIEKGKYRVDTDAGCVYSYRVEKDSWDRLLGSVNDVGFRQLSLYPGPRGMFMLYVYEHVAVWIAGNGMIPPGATVTHRDGDTTNNRLWNLCLMVPRHKKQIHRHTGQLDQFQADEIWKLYCSGMINHCRIAEALLIDRQKVRRAILKFKAGESFRFEQEFAYNDRVGQEVLRIRQASEAA